MKMSGTIFLISGSGTTRRTQKNDSGPLTSRCVQVIYQSGSETYMLELKLWKSGENRGVNLLDLAKGFLNKAPKYEAQNKKKQINWISPKLKASGVPWRLIRLRIWHCHSCGSGSIVGPGTSTCHGAWPKKKVKSFGASEGTIKKVKRRLTEWEKILGTLWQWTCLRRI